MSQIDQVLDFLGDIDGHSIRYEVKVLRAIKEWAISRVCDFTVGDRVQMRDTFDLDDLNGWAPYRETMAPGATAVVRRIDFNEHYGYWYANIVFDREWSVSDWNGVTRYWNGRADQTPEGYKPPSQFDQEKYPEGRRHTFAMPVKHLAASPSPEATE